jgi:L-serine dehydratase
VLLGLAGNEPASIDPAAIKATVGKIRSARRIDLAGTHSIPFEEARDLVFERALLYPPGALMQHPNGLRLKAYDAGGTVLDERTFFSIGGGFIAEDGVDASSGKKQAEIPFPFHNARALLASAHANELSISQLMLENECALAAHEAGRAPVAVVREGIEQIWEVMQACVRSGIAAEGILPGGLNVRRRAPAGRSPARERSRRPARRSPGSARLGYGVGDGGE